MDEEKDTKMGKRKVGLIRLSANGEKCQKASNERTSFLKLNKRAPRKERDQRGP